MIPLSRIQQAANTTAADILGASNSPLVNAADMFVRGARWFAGHLWHTPSERPVRPYHFERVTLILLRSNGEDSTIRTFTRQQIRDIFLAKRFRKYDPSIIAWAYLDDINPTLPYHNEKKPKR